MRAVHGAGSGLLVRNLSVRWVRVPDVSSSPTALAPRSAHMSAVEIAAVLELFTTHSIDTRRMRDGGVVDEGAVPVAG
jgi:hypothetical protein